MVCSRCLLTTLLSAAVFFASAASAMPIHQFDKMAISDQGDYLVVLIEGAQKVLLDAGKGQDAVKIHKLFTEVRLGDKMTIGMIELEENLARGRVADAERYARDHNVTRLEVEHAMLLTFKKNDIVLPPAFMHVADKFRPKLPVR
jgi:hypothetical protein